LVLVGIGLWFHSTFQVQRPRVQCHVDIKRRKKFRSDRCSSLFYLPPPPPATTTAIGHPWKRVFMLVFGVLTFTSHDHNDDNAENRGDGCASPILQQGTFSFEITNNMYLLTICQSLNYPQAAAHPPHSFWARQGGLLLGTSTPPPPPSKTSICARFWGWSLFATSLLPRKRACRLIFEAGCLYHHPYPPKTSICTCFRGQLFFATTTTLLPRKQAYVLVFEPGCSFPPPSPSKTSIHARFQGQLFFAPSSVENKHTRSFSRLVALCHHHHH